MFRLLQLFLDFLEQVRHFLSCDHLFTLLSTFIVFFTEFDRLPAPFPSSTALLLVLFPVNPVLFSVRLLLDDLGASLFSTSRLVGVELGVVDDDEVAAQRVARGTTHAALAALELAALLASQSCARC